MYALSFHCVDRTFLLISRDPACIKVGNMPFLLVVQYCDRGTHRLSCGFNTLGRLPASTDFTILCRFLNNLLWQVVFGGQDDSYTRTITRRCHRRSQLLFDEEKCAFTTLKKKLQQKVNSLSNVLGVIT